ncbi:carbohydrate-binding module family 13 protein [Rhizophagus clarus]|uniref:Carbohydrate-binding module family 13 protein n=1 Tax=Rhizophagus clarus TaxID=94130 RepID=A0A8H3QYQ1_9GLOM|nr:carbohydrate-binding module family 13 protein [Rhizophagus clarus]
MDDDKFLPKLSQNLLKILDDDEYYDITIEVGKEPYLPNIPPEIFQIILRYIYGGRLSLKECDTLDIIKILAAANELNLQELGPDKILESISLSSIQEKLLISIIQSNNLQMSEIQVWKYVLKWGLAQNPELPSDPETFSKEDFNVLKNTLQQFIPFIKFNNLTPREFSNEVLPYKKVLPKELYKYLLKIFLNSHPDSRPNDIKNVDSKIITIQHVELISKWIDKLNFTDELTSSYEFKLILRGSRDGFTPDKFHEICDNQSCTLTIVKVKGNNQILGGYNPIEWKSERSFVTAKDSFIFSFKNGDDVNEHILSRIMNENYAIFNDLTYGPSFGGADLILRGDNGHCMKDSYEKQIRGASSESVLHYGITCDCCNYTIRGERWKCTSCVNYDLCQVCKQKLYIHLHPDDHEFRLIPHSETLDRAPQYSIHFKRCDSCNNLINGVRWKCTFCKNYDLCQDCKSRSPNTQDHPNNHVFQPIGYSDIPFSLEDDPAICDYCESVCIYGKCFKCANGEFSVEEYELFQIIRK